MKKTVEHHNPSTLMKSPAFSQGISVLGSYRTIYVGGQNAVDASGALVGKDDLRAQTAKAVSNVRAVLQEAGADLEHLVRIGIYLAQGQSPQIGFEEWLRAWGERQNPPTVTVVFVAGLGKPDFLVEIEAIAVVAE